MSIIKSKGITFLKNHISEIKAKKNVEPIFFSNKSDEFHWSLSIKHTFHDMYEISFQLLENDNKEYSYLKDKLNVFYRSLDKDIDSFYDKIINKMDYFMCMDTCFCEKLNFTNQDMCVNCQLTLQNLDNDCPICLEPMVDSKFHVYTERCGAQCHQKCKIKSNDNKCFICRTNHCPNCGSNHEYHDDSDASSSNA